MTYKEIAYKAGCSVALIAYYLNGFRKSVSSCYLVKELNDRLTVYCLKNKIVKYKLKEKMIREFLNKEEGIK